MVDDVHVPWCKEAYTMVQLPASASSKGTASHHVKVNTGAEGNVLPLHVFKHLQPSWNQPSWPGSCQHQVNCIQQIPYTPILHTLWPHHLADRWPWHPTLQVNSYWYVADTPVLPSLVFHHVKG